LAIFQKLSFPFGLVRENVYFRKVISLEVTDYDRMFEHWLTLKDCMKVHSKILIV